MKTILEDSRGLQEATPEAKPRGRQVGPAGSTLVSPGPSWWPLPVSSLDYIYIVLQASLIQGLTLDPLGYIRRPQPP
jgi:hypothetical protein